MVLEQFPSPSNPLGIQGIEFVEFTTREPLALGSLLNKLGFTLTARHRSREVLLYRQGDMNIIVDADPGAVKEAGDPRAATIGAVALRVQDAGRAHRRVVDLGAWDMPTRAAAMELHIPGVHGVGDSLIYFVDRHREFSIYDVDFVRVEGPGATVPAIKDLHWFGLVQSVNPERTADWIDFYQTLFGFAPLPHGQYFGVLPKGTLLRSPCGTFYLQLIEPPPNADFVEWEETLLRMGLGTPDVLGTVAALGSRGIAFMDREPLRPSEKGAVTQIYPNGVCVEFVVSNPPPAIA